MLAGTNTRHIVNLQGAVLLSWFYCVDDKVNGRKEKRIIWIKNPEKQRSQTSLWSASIELIGYC